MTVSMGRITARLAGPNERVPAELVEMINRNIRPPEPLEAGDVHIRSMYIVSDQVNSFGGRFPVEEHQRLAELLTDSPVMVGHRKDKLPVGRNFHAVKTQRDGRPWVRSYFYWLRTADGSADLAENIDGGIYKECSVAFTFSLPECSICGKDIRLCPHQPLEKYSRSGHKETCHFNYRQIERVLETSLVYRGAVPETSMSKTLYAGVSTPRLIVSPEELDASHRYLIIPRYDAVEVIATTDNGRLAFTLPDGTAFGNQPGWCYQPSDFNPKRPVHGLLVGYRGKDRCPASQTRDFVERQAGPVSRLILNILPHQGIEGITATASRSILDVRVIPYREASKEEINRKALEIMTREGVELWSIGDNHAEAVRLAFHPRRSEDVLWSSLALHLCPDSGQALLTLRPQGKDTPVSFTVPAFDKRRLYSGGRFVAWPADGHTDGDAAKHEDGDNALVSLTKVEDAFLFESRGPLNGRFVLRPMKLHGRRGFLLSCIERQST